MTSRRSRFVIRTGPAGPWVRFVGRNGRVLFASETYTRTRGAEHAVTVVRRHVAEELAQALRSEAYKAEKAGDADRTAWLSHAADLLPDLAGGLPKVEVE